MVSETIALIAVLGSLTGAGLNAVRSYQQNPDPAVKFSYRKLFGAFLASTIPALATINFVALADTANMAGITGLFVLMALAGAGASVVVSASHK